MTRKLLLITFTFTKICLIAQQVYYVNGEATGSNNGDTWANAYTDIQTALQHAQYGDQIWIAEGMYKPTVDLNRNQSFVVPNGVSIWGGFSGSETSIDQRDILSNPTILSGEIGDQNTRSDNSFHVVVLLGADHTTVIDGFKIVLGNADGLDEGGAQSRSHGGGILVATDVLNPIAQPIIRNCFFENNRAKRGGGIACLGNMEFACVPDISNCTFTLNRAEIFGGAVYKEGINLMSKPFVIENCLSTKNYCQQIAGGIAIIQPSGIVRLQGCTFNSDSGRLEVGGVYLETGEIKTRYEVDSCFFYSNYSFNGCGGMTQLVSGLFLDTVEVHINNTLFSLNKNFVGAGGGFASYGFSKFQKINLDRCVFSHNFSQNGGGGVWIEGLTGCFTEINTDRCFFFGNLTGATSVAGGFYYRGYSGAPLKNTSTITNSVFMFNDGAIACLGGDSGITNTRVVNCSFYRNGPIPFLKYWKANLPATYRSTMQILNSVIWEPEADVIGHVFYNNDPTNLTVNDYLIEHSIIHLPDCLFNGVDPCRDGMIYGQWPNFIDSTGQIGLIPWADNPGINKGNNVVADTFSILKDFEGFDRVFCDSVDIGAYEVQANCSSVTDNITLHQLPMIIRLMQNPVVLNTPIIVEVFPAISMIVGIQLQDITGNVFLQYETRLSANIPTELSIPTKNCHAGLYFLSIMTNDGRSYTLKVVVD